MMLALVIYCYANGIFSSRRIERATHRDIGVRFVAANRHPDHDTLARFRRENFAAVSESFLQVLLLAKELKLLRVGLVSIDGSKFKANANKHRSVTYERAGALIAQLEGEIAALLGRPEAVLADNGYANGAAVAALEAGGIEALVSPSAEGRRRTHDFRPAKALPAAREPKADWLKAMAEKRASEEGRALYKRRRRNAGGPLYDSPIFSAARKASCGISTLPIWRMRFLPFFCLSSSLRLRETSPP